MEMEKTGINLLAITQTTLRGDINENFNDYRMLGKGRKNFSKLGGGVGLIFKEGQGITIEEIDINSNSIEGEDIAAYRCQGIKGNAKEKIGDFILIVCYMTVEGPNVNQNSVKYQVIENFIRNLGNKKIIIVGDMNGHTGILGEKVNRNGERLLEFAEINGFEILNHTIADGKITWVGNSFESAIDYILVNEQARELVKEMVIDEDGMVDIDSDHNILLLKYGGKEVNLGNKERKSNSGSKWILKNANYENFEMDLSELDLIYGSSGVELNDKITKSLNEAAGKSFKKVRMKGKQKKERKSWWNEEIEAAIAERKKLNKIQRSTNKLRKKGLRTVEEFKIDWVNYINAKKQASRLVNLAIEREETLIIETIRKQGEGQSRDWYQFIRGNKGKSLKSSETIKVDDRVVTGRENIKEEIEKFWGLIGGGKSGNFRYTCDIDLVNRRRNIIMDNDSPSLTEIREVLKKLKNNKGVGQDGIPYEFFKFGGEWVVRALGILYSKVWEEEVVPGKWNESKVLLLHKGGNKSKQLLKNYRPISLVNTIGKIFCYLLNERIKKATDEYNILGEEQNGFRKDRRGEDNIYIVKELIDKHNRDRSTLYLAFLDIEKAYDKVNRSTLIYTLEKLGFPSKLCKLINSMYKNTKSKFFFGDIETDWVTLKRGVRQGCVLSPLLFSIYTEELAARIRDSGLGVLVNAKRLGILLYADDVVLIADSEVMLQEMLDMATGYGNEFSLSFNYSKCGVLSINKPEHGRENFRLGNQEISRVRQYKYLGVLFEEGGTGRAKSERIFRANQWWGILCSMVKFRSNKYEVVREIWKSIAVPGILYAMDSINWTADEIRKIDVIQNKVGRLGLGANYLVGTEAIRGDMGWSTFEERLFKGKLKYKIRLEKMEELRWAKNMYQDSGTKSRWNMNCVRIANKCGFFRKWVDRGNGNAREWELSLFLGDSNDYSVRKWKVIINNKVKEFGLEKWKAGMEKKSTLKLYSNKVTPRKEVFFNGNWGSELLFKARSNSLEINERTYRFNERREKTCYICNMAVNETLDHLMTECPTYDQDRVGIMREYKEFLGEVKFREVISEDDNGLGFLLGLVEGAPPQVIELTKTFLCNIWRTRELAITTSNQLPGTEG